MCDDPTKSANDISIQDYEVLFCEPLHDITNVVQNIIAELPFHVPKEIQKEFEQFLNTTIGYKNQIKGSDARLYAIKVSPALCNYGFKLKFVIIFHKSNM